MNERPRARRDRGPRCVCRRVCDRCPAVCYGDTVLIHNNAADLYTETSTLDRLSTSDDGEALVSLVARRKEMRHERTMKARRHKESRSGQRRGEKGRGEGRGENRSSTRAILRKESRAAQSTKTRRKETRQPQSARANWLRPSQRTKGALVRTSLSLRIGSTFDSRLLAPWRPQIQHGVLPRRWSSFPCPRCQRGALSLLSR